jgi:hypothetical protein
MKNLRQYIKNKIRDYLTENKNEIFTNGEKTILISFYRNLIFNKIRNTELYKKYNGSTIPYEFSEENWVMLLNGMKDSRLNITIPLNNHIKKLEQQIKTPISTEFNPSTGTFLGFIDEPEKEASIKKTKLEINLLKKFIDSFNKNIL